MWRVLTCCGFGLSWLAVGLAAPGPEGDAEVDRPAPMTVPLWPGPAPLAHGSAPADVPSLGVYLATAPGPRPSVVICPGGGYSFLSLRFEGSHIARWFQARGVSAFVLKYRLPRQGYRYPAPFLDARRAMQLVRSRAVEWSIDPRSVGIIGFSAGGHLAALVATETGPASAAAPDPVDRLSDRPDFAILVYPVITMEPTHPQPQSRGNLLGPDPAPRLCAELSADRRVTSLTPPMLVLYAEDDPIVPAGLNGAAMVDALARAGVPHEVVAYASGGHGWGLGHDPVRGPAHWIDRVEAWLKTRGLDLTGH